MAIAASAYGRFQNRIPARRLVRLVLAVGVLAVTVVGGADASRVDGLSPAVSAAFHDQAVRASVYIARAISPADGLPGAIIASPSRSHPDYYYHWTRDAALITRSVFELCNRRIRGGPSAEWCRGTIIDMVEFSRLLQRTNALTGPGEPKFYVDGRPYNEPWGRPQTDGPALRAIAFIDLANQWLDEGRERDVRMRLYGGEALPARTPIKIDLEYVAHSWRQSSFDLWEEVLGDHFYTRLAQRRALLSGADLADRLGDAGAASFYREQAHTMEPSIAAHWDDGRARLRPTLRRMDGIPKPKDLDVAIVLAALHARGADGFFGPTDDRVLSTASLVRAEFAALYSLNRRHGGPQGTGAVAIGRYPEDTYDGEAGTGVGHPWFLATHAFAELSYLAAREYEAKGRIEINGLNRAFFQALPTAGTVALDGHRAYTSGSPEFRRLISALRMQGDDYLRVSLAHMDQNDGSMSEQFNRNTGYMLSAVHLTWSYSSYLSALLAR